MINRSLEKLTDDGGPMQTIHRRLRLRSNLKNMILTIHSAGLASEERMQQSP